LPLFEFVFWSMRRTHLGIRTPGRHLMSRLPNGCVPRTYCNGTPFPRLSQRFQVRKPGKMGEGVARTCSRIHRSSLAVDSKSRQALRRWVAMGEISLLSRQKREGGSRGIALNFWLEISACTSHDFGQESLKLDWKVRTTSCKINQLRFCITTVLVVSKRYLMERNPFPLSIIIQK
jgi:hypothetical protein